MSPNCCRHPLTALGLLVALGGCERERPAHQEPAATERSALLDVRTSDFVAGVGESPPAMANPYDGNVRARAEGERLYGWMNCAGCHGARGGGGIGPPFADRHWIYGGGAGQIFLSIYQGRPNGMPAFGGRLPDDAIWKIAAYVRSLDPEASSEREAQAPAAVGSAARNEAREGGRSP